MGSVANVRVLPEKIYGNQKMLHASVTVVRTVRKMY